MNDIQNEEIYEYFELITIDCEIPINKFGNIFCNESHCFKITLVSFKSWYILDVLSDIYYLFY